LDFKLQNEALLLKQLHKFLIVRTYLGWNLSGTIILMVCLMYLSYADPFGGEMWWSNLSFTYRLLRYISKMEARLYFGQISGTVFSLKKHSPGFIITPWTKLYMSRKHCLYLILVTCLKDPYRNRQLLSL
jgi:hypothetical protein